MNLKKKKILIFNYLHLLVQIREPFLTGQTFLVEFPQHFWPQISDRKSPSRRLRHFRSDYFELLNRIGLRRFPEFHLPCSSIMNRFGVGPGAGVPCSGQTLSWVSGVGWGAAWGWFEDPSVLKHLPGC